MELPNPDPYTGRPEHGGRDRHTCIAIRDVSKLKAILDEAGMDTVLGHFFNLIEKIQALNLYREFAWYRILFSIIIGIPYTLSRSGRPAIFTRDPDTNALEFTQVDCWNVFQISIILMYFCNPVKFVYISKHVKSAILITSCDPDANTLDF